MSSPSKCPICGKPAAPQFRPFCSAPCRDRDLLNWLGEAYRVPGQVNDDEAERPLDNADSDRL
ncbi:DNA gyrase inhibitor YacG [Pedomonas sp. V897]|uniref:DNA gyrase inhibitor YacG n=1 Tax=Pedomonas sp. V897 TaxID=3446482 RepID=UPI003EE40EC1